MVQPSLIERQRAAAREEIARSALHLFICQGFEETTIDQIVAAVGISRRSFFRYFGTKEDIVLGDLIARGTAVAQAVAARPATEDPWVSLRAGLATAAPSTMPPSTAPSSRASQASADLALTRMLFDTPSLRARHLEKRLRWQELLVPIIQPRLDDRDGAAWLRAAAIVATTLACLDVASQAWVASDGALDLAALYDSAVTAVRESV